MSTSWWFWTPSPRFAIETAPAIDMSVIAQVSDRETALKDMSSPASPRKTSTKVVTNSAMMAANQAAEAMKPTRTPKTMPILASGRVDPC